MDVEPLSLRELAEKVRELAARVEAGDESAIDELVAVADELAQGVMQL
jgi:predicted NBD/HSP70 family sugar kinase